MVRILYDSEAWLLLITYLVDRKVFWVWAYLNLLEHL